MKTTATHYAILGGGRLARHMHLYLGLLGQECSGWARNRHSSFNTHDTPDAELRLRETIEPASHVLLLVSDDAIAPLVRQYPFLHSKQLIHCAGALSLPGIAGAHPLMTFSESWYTLEQYREIPFLVESGQEFADLFPALPNPYHTVAVEQKALYHALCVMAGNFPQILWQSVSEQFRDELKVPPQVLHAYLRQSLENFIHEGGAALTGPLARGDEITMQRNMAALADIGRLQDLYAAFASAYATEKKAGEDLQEEAL